MSEATASPGRTERDDLTEKLDEQHGLFLVTANGLSDEQARLTPTASALSIGGLIKHVSSTVEGWHGFVEGSAPHHDEDPIDWGSPSEESVAAFMAGFALQDGETLADTLEAYERVHARTIELVRTVDLDQSHPLPPAPWFPPDTSWSNRKVFIHLLAETAQHAGHADIIRESIDGQKTMG